MVIFSYITIYHNNEKVQMQIRNITYLITKLRYQIQYYKGIKLDTFRVKLNHKTALYLQFKGVKYESRISRRILNSLTAKE